jgi:hypothetical protein
MNISLTHRYLIKLAHRRVNMRIRTKSIKKAAALPIRSVELKSIAKCHKRLDTLNNGIAEELEEFMSSQRAKHTGEAKAIIARPDLRQAQAQMNIMEQRASAMCEGRGGHSFDAYLQSMRPVENPMAKGLAGLGNMGYRFYEC